MAEEDDFSPAFAGSGSALPNPYGTGFEIQLANWKKHKMSGKK